MFTSIFRVLPFLLLLFLGGGLSLTVLGLAPSLPLLQKISHFSYATMAPFQVFDRENAEIIADGLQRDGSWVSISLKQYLPLPQGERYAWTALWSIAVQKSDVQDDPGRMPGYRRMAELLLQQERKRGNPLTAVRLVVETWPISSEGYLALRHPPFLQRTLIVQVP